MRPSCAGSPRPTIRCIEVVGAPCPCIGPWCSFPPMVKPPCWCVSTGASSSVSPGSCVTSRWRRARHYVPGPSGQGSHAGAAAELAVRGTLPIGGAGTTGRCCAVHLRLGGHESSPCAFDPTVGAGERTGKDSRVQVCWSSNDWGRDRPPSQPHPQWCFGADRSLDQHPGSPQGPSAVGRRNRSRGLSGRVSNPPKT
jgi:hypothetical protein